MLTIHGMGELCARVGEELGVSAWHAVTQDEVDAFAAAAAGDHQWIHVDPERARQTPFGGTIAHGLYALSLGPRFAYAMFTIEGVAFGVNYGYDRVRFPAPLPVGRAWRMRATLAAVDDTPPRWARLGLSGLALTPEGRARVVGGHARSSSKAGTSSAPARTTACRPRRA